MPDTHMAAQPAGAARAAEDWLARFGRALAELDAAALAALFHPESYWRDLLELGTLTSDDTRVHFINHFSGCQMCTQQNKEDNYGECEAEFRKSYSFANEQFGVALARKPPRNVTHHAAVASSVYCVKHPAAPECAEAVKAFEAYERDGARDAQAKYAVKG